METMNITYWLGEHLLSVNIPTKVWSKAERIRLSQGTATVYLANDRQTFQACSVCTNGAGILPSKGEIDIVL
jgi:hypothetical protein